MHFFWTFSFHDGSKWEKRTYVICKSIILHSFPPLKLKTIFFSLKEVLMCVYGNQVLYALCWCGFGVRIIMHKMLKKRSEQGFLYFRECELLNRHGDRMLLLELIFIKRINHRRLTLKEMQCISFGHLFFMMDRNEKNGHM